MKYALYKYSTRNIGDEIQSIAARQFLPKIDYYIDRDKLSQWQNQTPEYTVKLIANAWYMGSPMLWPPKEPTIDILLVSMHVHDANPDVKGIFSSRDSVNFLQNSGDIGARDASTVRFFDSINVSSYFSACLTLTLQKDEAISKKGFILCVTTSDEVYESIKKQTDRTVLRIDTTTFDESLSTEERFKLAEQFLYLYQSAHFVVTTRLHAALPCLALEVPVLYITDSGAAKYDPSRLEGLKDLTNNTTEVEFISSVTKYNFELPQKNPKKYVKYRNSLVKRCEDFTGHKKANKFTVLNNFSDFNLESAEVFKTIIMNYDNSSYEKSMALENQELRTQDLQKAVDQLGSTRIAIRKVAGNAKRKARRILNN